MWLARHFWEAAVRKVLVIAAAAIAAALGFTFVEGKPDARACVGGPVDPPPDSGNSGQTQFYSGGTKHGKDGAVDGS